MFKKNISKAYWSIAIPELYLFLDTHWLKRILLHCAMLYSSGMYSIWSQLKHIWGIWGATFVVTCVQMVCYHMLSPCSCHRSVNILAISGITSPNLCANPPPLDMAREKVTRTSPRSNQALQGRHTTDIYWWNQWISVGCIWAPWLHTATWRIYRTCKTSICLTSNAGVCIEVARLRATAASRERNKTC